MMSKKQRNHRASALRSSGSMPTRRVSFKGSPSSVVYSASSSTPASMASLRTPSPTRFLASPTLSEGEVQAWKEAAKEKGLSLEE